MALKILSLSHTHIHTVQAKKYIWFTQGNNNENERFRLGCDDSDFENFERIFTFPDSQLTGPFSRFIRIVPETTTIIGITVTFMIAWCVFILLLLLLLLLLLFTP